jgi:hypothetical protein
MTLVIDADEVITDNGLPGEGLPMPTLPDTNRPFAGGVVSEPIDIPPAWCTNILVLPFTCTRKGFLPEALFTCSRSVGVVVPMPTRPEVSMRMRSMFFVWMRRGIELVVPSFEEAFALELPSKLQYGEAFWAWAPVQKTSKVRMQNREFCVMVDYCYDSDEED